MSKRYEGTPGRRAERGLTLLEVAIGTAIVGLLLVFLGSVVSLQANILGHGGDDANTVVPAIAALNRIRDELRSAAHNPPGVTASPVYAASATSMTFRRADGFGDDGLSPAGRVSENGVRYARFATTISFVVTEAPSATFPSGRGEVRLARSGTLPAGMPASEVLCRNVTDFAFFDGASTANPPIAPVTATQIIGFRIVVSRPSAMPGARGAPISSTLGSPSAGSATERGLALQTKVKVLPELITDTEAIPVVGP